ncbi:MAG: cell division protein ZapA [Rhodospirillales bacterium]|nr:cell division protein ZapA [Rhodospirillales bacterium]MSP79497.1 cell division protein ZapA [Rhodospirillales bacterium]
MAQTAVRINGRSYPIVCDDGQEAHLAKLALFIDKRIEQLAAAVGCSDDARLLVMASLLVADELMDAQAESQTVRAGADKSPAMAAAAAAAEDAVAQRIERIAVRIEGLAERLEQASA